MANNEVPEQPEAPEQGASSPPQAGSSSEGPFGIPTKWLLIGGAGGGGVLAVIIVVVVLLLTGVFGGGNPQPTSILDLVPDDSDLIVMLDVQRILGNDLLEEEFWSNDDWSWLEDDLDMVRDDLSEVAVLARGGSEIIVLSGNFDLDGIRDELEDADNEENSYRGYEIWEDPDGSAGALLESYILFSDAARPVENVLKNLYNGEGSIARADDDNEMKQVLDKLPGGFVKFAQVGDYCLVERCEGYGWAMTEVDEDDEEGTVEIAMLFRNERGAENAADDYDEVADFLEQEGFDIEDTEADGVFVTGQAILDLEEEESSEPRAPSAPAAEARTAATAAPTAATLPEAQPAMATPTAAATAATLPEWVRDCSNLGLLLEIEDCICIHNELVQEAGRNGLGQLPPWDEVATGSDIRWYELYEAALRPCI